jgi:hypothetical protein
LKGDERRERDCRREEGDDLLIKDTPWLWQTWGGGELVGHWALVGDAL